MPRNASRASLLKKEDALCSGGVGDSGEDPQWIYMMAKLFQPGELRHTSRGEKAPPLFFFERSKVDPVGFA